MMRRLAVAACAFILLAAGSVATSASLRIEEFAATIVLEESGDLYVTERITANFFTSHHGIERFITIAGRTPWGETVRIVMDVRSVLMDDGTVPYTQRTRGNERILRIGDPDRTVIGVHTYEIRYTVQRALLFSDSALRLYWNVTGNGWDIPIVAASAVVRLPGSVALGRVSATSYVGYTGSSSRGASPSQPDPATLQFASGILLPGQGLTIDVSIPRDLVSIDPPSFAQRVWWFLSANKYAALPILTLLVMTLLWAKLGKDPRKRAIAPAFEPPSGIHPGAAGVLIDDRIDLRDISAMLVGLAVKGVLAIRGSESEDYVFVRQRPSAEGLSPAETAVYDALFDTPETEERSLGSLEQRFYQSLPTIKSRLYAELIGAGYYKSNPERTRRAYTTVGVLTFPLAVFLGIQTLSLVLALSIAMSGLIVLAFARIMPRKTREGVRKLEEVLGLSEYIRRAEVDRIEFHDAPEKGPQLFEQLLPYAIALNLTKIWTRQFEGLLDEPPQWYSGPMTAPVFNMIVFSHTLSSMTRSMQRTFVSAPRSSGRSAWSGRSFGGGSFGGGFSGGGFGGGGGGGW